MEITKESFIKSQTNKRKFELYASAYFDKSHPLHKIAACTKMRAKRLKKILMAIGVSRNEADAAAKAVNNREEWFDERCIDILWKLYAGESPEEKLAKLIFLSKFSADKYNAAIDEMKQKTAYIDEAVTKLQKIADAHPEIKTKGDAQKAVSEAKDDKDLLALADYMRWK